MNSGQDLHISNSEAGQGESHLDQFELRKEHKLMRDLQHRMLDQLNKQTKSSSMKHLLETLTSCCRDMGS